MSSKQKLLDLINSTNFPTLPLSDVNVDVSSPQVVTGDPQANTSIQVTAKPNAGYVGARTLFYRRLDLSVLGALQFASADAQGDATRLLNLLNTQLPAAELGADDVQAFTVPTPGDNQNAACVISAAPTSLRWVGEITVQVQGVQTSVQGSISDGGLQESFPPNVWNPSQGYFAGSPEMYFGQYTFAYPDGQGGVQLQETTGAGPYALPNGWLVHYQVNLGQTGDASYAMGYIAPPTMQRIPDTTLLDPVRDAQFIADFTAALPFALQMRDAQGRVLGQLYYGADALAPDEIGNIYVPSAWNNTTDWTLENSLIADLVMVAQPDNGVRQVFLYPLPLVRQDANADLTDVLPLYLASNQLGEANMQLPGDPNKRQMAGTLDGVRRTYIEVHPISRGFGTTFGMYTLTDTTEATSKIDLWLTNAPEMDAAGHFYPEDNQPAPAVETHPQQPTRDWYNASLPLMVRVLDVDDNVLGEGVFTTPCNDDIAPHLEIDNVQWVSAEPRKGVSFLFVRNAPV